MVEEVVQYDFKNRRLHKMPTRKAVKQVLTREMFDALSAGNRRGFIVPDNIFDAACAYGMLKKKDGLFGTAYTFQGMNVIGERWRANQIGGVE